MTQPANGLTNNSKRSTIAIRTGLAVPRDVNQNAVGINIGNCIGA